LPSPLGVSLNGLEAIYDYIATPPGLSGATTKSLPTHALPGWSLAGQGYTITAAYDLSGYDHSGFDISLYSGGPYSGDNVKFHNIDGGLAVLSIGEPGGSEVVDVSLTHVLFDHRNEVNLGGSGEGADYGYIGVSGNCSLTLDYVSFIRAGLNNFNSGADLTISHFYFDAPGQRASEATLPHYENYHAFGNEGTTSFWTDGIYDASNANTTGILQVHLETYNGNITETWENVIFYLGPGVRDDTFAGLQITARFGHTVTLNLINCVIDKGSSTWIIVNQFGGTIIVNSTGTRDLVTGNNIDDELIALSSGIVTSSGAMTLTMGMGGTVRVGNGLTGAMTLQMGAMSGAAAAYGPVIGSGAMTLTMGAMSGQVSHAVASGDMTLTMGMAGTVTQTDSASAAGAMFLEMGMAGSAAAGVSASGAMILSMGMSGSATAAGIAAPTRGSSGKTARPKGPKTVTAPSVI
jgi:hypothetical protein